MRKRAREGEACRRTPKLFQKAQTKKIIEVYFLDFDGCFGPHCVEQPDNANDNGVLVVEPYQSMADFNVAFVHKLIEKHKDLKECVQVIFSVGSSRQSPLSDLQGMAQKSEMLHYFSGSCFVEMEAFVAHIQQEFEKRGNDIVSLDRFLVSDIFHKQQFGYTFSNAVQTHGNYLANLYCEDMGKLHETVPALLAVQHATYAYSFSQDNEKQLFFDEGKFTLLMTQIHRFASEAFNDDENAQESDIHFHFYDDRLDILNPLCAIFGMHPELLPECVTLHLHLYEQGLAVQGSTFTPINGVGMTDHDYAITAIALREMALTLKPQNRRNYIFTDNLAGHFIEAVSLEKESTCLSSAPLLLQFIEMRQQRLLSQKEGSESSDVSASDFY
ncbi:MAG: hypothetical protein NTZ67_07430 [Gammaproteobacteria bacterium]|nr:hypothetical protein [Gammaproteobacteria bacterium]